MTLNRLLLLLLLYKDEREGTRSVREALYSGTDEAQDTKKN